MSSVELNLPPHLHVVLNTVWANFLKFALNLCFKFPVHYIRNGHIFIPMNFLFSFIYNQLATNTVLLEKLMVSQPLTKIPATYATWSTITLFIRNCQFFLPWSWGIKSVTVHRISARLIVIWFFYIQIHLKMVPFFEVSSTNILYISLFPEVPLISSFLLWSQ
jgi:hypothetical protein